MNQSWLGAEAGLVTCSMRHVLDQKGGKLLRNGQKGQWDLSDLLISGPRGRGWRTFSHQQLDYQLRAPQVLFSVMNRERGPYTSPPHPTLYLKELMGKEGLNSF